MKKLCPMKKLCRSTGAIHPSPPTISDHLAFLPAYLLALTASLSPEDLEVLAYLISANNTDDTAVSVPPSKKGSRKNPSSAAKSGGKGRLAGSCSVFGGGGGKGGDAGDHDPNFCCDCFRCYMSYWVRWDTSPNRQLIDEIIDSYEARLTGDGCSGNNGRGGRGRKERRKARGLETQAAVVGAAESSAGVGRGGEQGSMDMEIIESDQDEGCVDVDDGDRGDEAENGSVRRLVSFIGERIWGFWN